MSMISAQCDELRKAADELQDIIDNGHNYTWHGIFTILHYAQQALRSAADIIWELRNKLAGTVDQQDEIERLKAENAKLRELVRVMAYCAYDEHSCDRCAMNGAEMHVTVDRSLCCDGMLEKLSGLGIEADDA